MQVNVCSLEYKIKQVEEFWDIYKARDYMMEITGLNENECKSLLLFSQLIGDMQLLLEMVMEFSYKQYNIIVQSLVMVTDKVFGVTLGYTKMSEALASLEYHINNLEPED
jgi:hypothetical protein